MSTKTTTRTYPAITLDTQPHEVVTYRLGRPINWCNPPAPTARVRWSKRDTSGRAVTGSLRTIAHLNRLNNLALGEFGRGIEVIQPPFHTGVAASAGTHDKDACADVRIPGVDWRTQERFFRRHGFACWFRYPPLFGYHVHGFTLPPRQGTDVSDDFKAAGFTVGKYVDGGHSTAGYRYTSSQIEDYYNHALGLSSQHRPGCDRSWYPPLIRATIFDLHDYIARRATHQQLTRAATKAARSSKILNARTR